MEHVSHISEHLSQSLRSLVRKERAISWPKRTLHRFKWFRLARRPYSNVTIRSSPSRDSFCRKQAERKDFDLRQKWWQLWQSSQTRCSSTCSDTSLESRWRGRCKFAGSSSSPKCAVHLLLLLVKALEGGGLLFSQAVAQVPDEDPHREARLPRPLPSLGPERCQGGQSPLCKTFGFPSEHLDCINHDGAIIFFGFAMIK